MAAAVNDIENTTWAYADSSKLTSAGLVSVTASESATINALTIGGAVAVGAGGNNGGAVAVAGASSTNTVKDNTQAYISNSTTAGSLGVSAVNGAVTLSATDLSTITANGGGVGVAVGAGGTNGAGVSVGFSAAVNDVENTVWAYIDNATVTATGGSATLTATEIATIQALTIGGAVGVGAGGSNGVGVGAAGAGSGNTIKDSVKAYIRGGSQVSTVNSGNVTLLASDMSTITANGGGVGIGVGAGGSNGVGASLGVAAAVNDIENTVWAYADGSTLTSAGTLSVTASETAIITALTIGGAVAVGAGGNNGVGVAVAGADSNNTVKDNVQAYLSNSTSGGGKGISATGAVTLSATDISTITANGGGVGVAVGAGGSNERGVSVGFSAAVNDVENTVWAYISNATVTATGGNAILTATETAIIQALTIGGAVGVGAGGSNGVGVGAAGAGSGNTIKDSVKAYIQGGSQVTTVNSGNITLLASDMSTITANGGGVGIGVGAGGSNGVGASLGVAAAVNDIENTVWAYADGSTLTSAGTLSVSASETAIITALTIGGAVAVGAGGSNGVGVAVAGADSNNTVKDNVQAYLSNSTSGGGKGISATGAVTLSATDISTITANGGGVGVAVGAGGSNGAGVSVGFSAAVNDVENTVWAYISNATVTATGGNATLTATETAIIQALTIGGAVGVGAGGSSGVGVGAAGAGSGNTIKNWVEAYIQSGSQVTTLGSGNITLTALDGSTITANGGGVGIGVGAGGSAGVGASLGVAIAINDIENHVLAFVSTSQTIAAGAVSLSATETGGIQALSIGGAVAVGGGGSAGVGVAAAGAASQNTVRNTVQAFAGDPTFDTNALWNSNLIMLDPSVSFQTGAPVTYGNGGGTSLGISGGALTSSTYYVFVPDQTHPNQIQLATSLSNAQHGIPVYLTSLGTGKAHTITTVPTTGTGTVYTFDPTTAVTLPTDALTLSGNPGFTNGQQVFYSNGGGSNIVTSTGTLQNGASYYAIVDPNHPTQVKLATSLQNALNGTAIHLLSPGPLVFGTQQRLTLKLPNIVTAGHGAVTMTASDTSTVTANGGGVGVAVGGGGAAGVGVTVGLSVAINTIENVVQAYVDNATVHATGGNVALSATESSTINALTIGGAVAVGGGGAAGVGVGLAGAGSANTVQNVVEAFIQNTSDVRTFTSGDVTLGATDTSIITANGGGVGISVGAGGGAGVGVSLGVAVATNDIENHVKAFVDSSTVAAAGALSLTALETGTITALTIGGAVSVGSGGAAGVGVAVAGSDSTDTIKNHVQAYVHNSATFRANNGGITISATDTSSITANGGGAGVSVGVGGGAGVAAAVGFAVVTNDVENVVQAYIDSSTATATANVAMSAIEAATIVALSIGGAVSVAVGGVGAAAAAGAGGNSTNTVKNQVEAYFANASSITSSAGSVSLTATDTATATTKTVAAAVSIAAGGLGSGAIGIGAAIADNDIEDTVRAYSAASNIASNGTITLTATALDTSTSLSVAATVSAAVSLASLSLSGAGATSTNTINNTIASFIAGTDSTHRSTITAPGNISLSAGETATVVSNVGSGAISFGVAGASVGTSLATDTITSSVKAYADNANLTSSGGGISFAAGAADNVTTLSVATAVAVAIGGAGAGASATDNVSPTVEAYAGSATTLNASTSISLTSTATNSASATTYGAAGGLVAIGTSTVSSTADGSVKSHDDGIVSGCSSLTIQATATDSTDAEATALSGGIVSGDGADATATTSPTVLAYTGNHSLNTAGAINVTATLTPKAVANSIGIAVAELVAIGALLATASVAPTVEAYAGGSASTITAGSLTLVATQNIPVGADSAYAKAIGASGGGLVGVSASVSTATNGDGTNVAQYQSYVADGTTLIITGATVLNVNSNSQQNSLADNYNLGLVAAGAGSANASSNTLNKAYLGNNVSLTGSSLSVTAMGSDNNTSAVMAGSGGAFAGAGAAVTTATTSTTIAAVQNGDGTKTITLTGAGTGTFQIKATHTATFNSSALTFAGGVLAGAGAQTTNTVNSDDEANVGNSAIVRAKSIDIEAANHVNKPTLPDYTNAADPNKTGPNILGATGGLASAAGATSETDISFTTLVTIGSFADLQVPIGATPGTFTLATLNDIVANDKVSLNTGGAISGAGAFSTIKTIVDRSQVEISHDAVVKNLQGVLNISARGQGNVSTDVNADTYGAATVAVTNSVVDIEPTNTVLVDANATLFAQGDLDISAGTDVNFNRDQYTISARTDTLAGMRDSH